ncbi:MAG: hypothetical protein DRI44_05565 [Chlamydiae bacterium]|nr:MAG: hypothetical protein DRI44_05565 [Chlamydiota bacterium]
MSIKKKQNKLSKVGKSFGVSFAIHLAIFFTAASFIVYKYVKPQEMMFKPTKKLSKMPARKLQHKIRVKQYEKQAQRPKLMNKLVTTGKSKITLPKLPPLKFSKSDFKSIPANITPIGGNIGQIGLGNLGIGKGDESAFEGFAEAEFFGHKIKTRSIVILADSSSSVVKKGVFEDLKKEAIAMVQKFHPDTGFNVILFTDGAFPFKTNIAYATQSRKRELAKWMKKNMKMNKGGNSATKGSSPIEALKAAIKMKPDTIVLITDDPPWLGKNTIAGRAAHVKEIYKAIRDGKNTTSNKFTIDTVLYKPKEKSRAEARAFMKSVARSTGGHFREVK